MRLEISGLTLGYGRRPILNDASLEALQGGGITALVGPNGAGKSTLLRGLAGLLPAKGSVRLDGQEMVGRRLEERARHIAYMPQSLPQGVALTVLEALLGALRASPTSEGVLSAQAATDRAVHLLERLGIGHLALTALDRLSGGQRQLAGLAQALVRRPRVLLLDEPTSALDLRHQLSVMALVRELTRQHGLVTVVVLHDLALAARFSDAVVMIAEGVVRAQGTPEATLTPAMLAEVYGVSARVERCSMGHLQVLADSPLPG
ncbi:ABC transporter ATP-binding protein [Pseudoroseomonas cervicalis]|uniref:ABC transporter ATP-binding protein n=1 Tax=Teichococcus cervicalis TaxID=204525 RepID=UPI0022F1AD37|nr:ABC transporter ATP-binding protein [Pseudoroseomonas cervicalis]WBV42315.1 ABC transporter ATP-binding protein [Pseudoroseomonas cervicalis]